MVLAKPERTVYVQSGRQAIKSRLHDGLATLLRKVAQFDTESVETIIPIAATDPEAAEAFLDAQCGRPLRESCHLAQGPLMALSPMGQEQSRGANRMGMRGLENQASRRILSTATRCRPSPLGRKAGGRGTLTPPQLSSPDQGSPELAGPRLPPDQAVRGWQ
jgi:hypothetical protein